MASSNADGGPPADGLDPDATIPYPAGVPDGEGGRFRRLVFVGRGGEGEVWTAWDATIGRKVAVKLPREDQPGDAGGQARFLHEAEITAMLEHRGIPPVYDRGTIEDGRPFYAMRFVEGTSLREAIDVFHDDRVTGYAEGDRSLRLRALLGRFVDVCEAVEYAHSRGVLHGDIKPGNVILDEYGETLVVDWGMSLAWDPNRPAEGSEGAVEIGAPMGTPGFMSPEQAAGGAAALTPRSEVYSLGATLYALLTGRPAFVERDLGVVLAQVRAGAFPRPRRLDPRVPPALEAICLKAMALRPEDRYATPRELASDVERWLGDQPVVAYPERLPARLMRWVRRHRWHVAAVVAVVMVLAIALAVDNLRIAAEERRTIEVLGQTRQALRDLLSVSGESLVRIPDSEPLRERLARLVLDRYRQLLERFPEDRGIRLETAQVHRVLAGIARITGHASESRASYAEAIRTLEGLCREDPGDPEPRRWLVEALLERGELEHMGGRTSDAEADFRGAIREAERLAAPNGPTAEQRRAEASARINLSEVLLIRGRYAEAKDSAAAAAALLEMLATRPAAERSPRDLWLYSMALADRGAAALGAGDPAGAAQDLDAAERHAAMVSEDSEMSTDARFQLATIANRRGELLASDPSGRGRAVESYASAAAILRDLITAHPQVGHYREELAESLIGRASVRFDLGFFADSRQDCRDARECLDRLMVRHATTASSRSPRHFHLFAQAVEQESRLHYQAGDVETARTLHDEAIRTLQEAIRIDPARAGDVALLARLRGEGPR